MPRIAVVAAGVVEYLLVAGLCLVVVAVSGQSLRDRAKAAHLVVAGWSRFKPNVPARNGGSR
ncbi:MAG: hypothetical protein LBG70_02855 [Bifidobacteriaceae bacterium]|nr:hypothetical protein [Bifidobacteriaceae bacterium]